MRIFYPGKEGGINLKVVLGLSGGIDSTMSAYFLREQGHEVLPVTLVFSEENKDKTVRKAHETAEALGLREPAILDLRTRFKKTIIDTFVSFYERGMTPNPCVFCNEKTKFSGLFEMACKLGCDAVATGHYARIGRKGSRLCLLRGIDPKKDQSYMLYRLKPELYGEVLFPLGRWTKAEIKEMGKKLYPGLFESESESNDLCFLKKGELPFFLKKNVKSRAGEIRSVNGKVLGTHDGLSGYTIGQRQGLGLAGGPWFVVSKDLQSNTLVVGRRADLSVNVIECSDVILHEALFVGQIVSMRHRYRSSFLNARILQITRDGIRLQCLETAYGVAPGQSSVLYSGERTLGGGIIEKTC